MNNNTPPHKITIHDEVALLERAQHNAKEDGAPYVVFQNLSSTQVETLCARKYNYIAKKHIPETDTMLMAFTWLPANQCDEIRKKCFQ